MAKKNTCTESVYVRETQKSLRSLDVKIEIYGITWFGFKMYRYWAIIQLPFLCRRDTSLLMHRWIYLFNWWCIRNLHNFHVVVQSKARIDLQALDAYLSSMHNAKLNLVSKYFDHGATSFPKPGSVAESIVKYIDDIGGTYGRAAYSQAHQASSIVFDAREKLAEFIGVSDSSRIVFTQNTTVALNIAIQSMCKPGKTVLVSPLEHNSVMRPLEMMSKRCGIKILTLPYDNVDGTIRTDQIKVDDNVCLAVVNHVSNVNGIIQPIGEIKRRLGLVPLLVDAAQSVGEVPIDASLDMLDLVALPGHKHLMGPTGTGALYVKKGLVLNPLTPGGTGSRSESIEQPLMMPDALEGGTPNIVGIVGLNASLDFLSKYGAKSMTEMTISVLQQLKALKNITVYAAANPLRQGSLFSFSISNMTPSDIAFNLFLKHGIAVRSGLHCAPEAHKALGTFDDGGTLRVSFGYFHTPKDADNLVKAIAEVSGN